jgi:hypothetical protein
MDYEASKSNAAVPQMAKPDKETKNYFTGGHKRA